MPQEPTAKELADFMRQEHPEFANEQDDDTLAHFALSEHPALGKIAPKLELPSLGAQAYDAVKQFGNAVINNVKGFGEVTNPIAPGMEPMDIIKGPMMAATQPRSMGLLSDMMIGHMKDEYAASNAGFQQITDAPDLKGKIEGAGDYVAHSAGMLPVYGPMISGAYEHFKKGEIGQGIGNLLGMVAPELAGKYANSIGPPVPPVERAIPLSWAERKGGVMRKIIENHVENTAVGKSAFKPLRLAQQAKIQAMGAQLVEDISPLSGDTPGLGQMIQEKFDAYDKDLKADEQVANEHRALTAADRPTKDIQSRAKLDAVSSALAEQQTKDTMPINDAKVAADVIKAALEHNPDSAYKLLLKPKLSVDRLQYVKGIVGPDVYRGMTAQLVQDFLRSSTSPEITEIGTGELRQPAQIGKTMLNRLSKTDLGQKLRNIMEPSEYAKLRDIASISASLHVSPMVWMQRLDNIFTRALVIGGPTALLSGNPVEGIAVAAGAEGIRASGFALAARLMVRPEGATNIREFVRAIGRNDVRRIAFYSMRIQDHVEREVKKQYSNAQPLPQTPKQKSLLPPPPG